MYGSRTYGIESGSGSRSGHLGGPGPGPAILAGLADFPESAHKHYGVVGLGLRASIKSRQSSVARSEVGPRKRV